MISLFVLLLSSPLVKSVDVFDCGKGDKWITLVSADIVPDPVIYPGNVTLIGDFDLSHDLPDHDVLFSLNIKKLQPFPMKVPCLKGIGSCTYDLCKDIVPYHKKEFCDLGSCTCPILAKHYSTRGIHYQLPVVGGKVFKKILEGKYTANLTFYNAVSKQEYGCFGMNFEVKAAP